MISLLKKHAKEFEIRERINYILRLFQLVQKTRIKEVSANYTITLEDHTVLVDCTSGALTITLPKAYDAFEYEFRIMKVDAGGNAVTVDGNGSETINGATTLSLASQYSAATIQSDQTEYYSF